MKANIIMELAKEVIYLEKEAAEAKGSSLDDFISRKKEARHIMVKLFGSSTTAKAIIEVREAHKEETAFQMWSEMQGNEYVYNETFMEYRRRSGTE